MPSAGDRPPAVLAGGEWLLTAVDPAAVFTPERLTEEHRLIGRTTDQFVSGDVLPATDRLEQKDWAVARRLLARSGELGLLAVDVPEAYGGMQLDKVASMVVSERMAPAASFAATFGAQANLAILPLMLFGTEDQKRKYLPRLMTAEIVGAYCLSEPGSGSDALGARTTARRRADGGFILNGEKAWITNGGFADLFIVFAKVDGGQFSAFLVERTREGVAGGNEERKMGLHGSSTTPVFLQDVSVPAENLLGEVGKGHKVAFDVLNFGRFKLGAACVGTARTAIGEAAAYAAGRKQFGRPIASFGAIKHKLGDMVAQTYAVESLLYRTAGMIDARIATCRGGTDDAEAARSTLEEYAIEASIAKVAGSEALDDVLDENIQIHGGNGYVRDYPAEGRYRDARVNRIFEGTNEINRLVIAGRLARRAAQADRPLARAAEAREDEVRRPVSPPLAGNGVEEERRAVEALKKAALLVFGHAPPVHEPALSDDQEVLIALANILIDVYGAESAVLRAAAALAAGHPTAPFQLDAARLVVRRAASRIEAEARQAVGAMIEGDRLQTALASLGRLVQVAPVNTVGLRRRLADQVVDRGGYLF